MVSKSYCIPPAEQLGHTLASVAATSATARANRATAGAGGGAVLVAHGSLWVAAGHSVRFLVVEAYALGVHGRPRATGDLDVRVDPTPENAPNVIKALAAFGAPMGEISGAV